MAVYNKQRYYWIKITDKFMTSDTVDFLMEQKDGANYVVIYQMLCLKTINNNGRLARTLGEVIIPYNEEKIQRDLKWFSIDTIRVALELYKKLGLILEQADGIFKIADFENLIGSQTISAAKKQEQLNFRGCGGGGKNSTLEVENLPPDIDKEKDKEINKNRTNEHKKIIINEVSNNQFRTRESYDQIMDDCELEKEVRPMMSQFIKHCALNGHRLTNEKLSNICITMDFQQLDATAKIAALQKAISGGYYDIKRS